MVEAKLDESFFRVRAERTTELELRYLRAIAELGPDTPPATWPQVWAEAPTSSAPRAPA